MCNNNIFIIIIIDLHVGQERLFNNEDENRFSYRYTDEKNESIFYDRVR